MSVARAHAGTDKGGALYPYGYTHRLFEVGAVAEQHTNEGLLVANSSAGGMGVSSGSMIQQ